ncbi:MAG TPA: CsgG/HfaB family protein, partial [bacterium]|nr:CsgG/HfaB family protein [bacterium]
VLGALSGAVKKSHMAMDIRIIDGKTSEILAATRVEGTAKEVNLGAIGAGIFGYAPMAGGLSIYSKTPMEKAIRLCLKEAVKYIIDNTPGDYFRH